MYLDWLHSHSNQPRASSGAGSKAVAASGEADEARAHHSQSESRGFHRSDAPSVASAAATRKDAEDGSRPTTDDWDPSSEPSEAYVRRMRAAWPERQPSSEEEMSDDVASTESRIDEPHQNLAAGDESPLLSEPVAVSGERDDLEIPTFLRRVA
jgi:hypothetical protein